MNCAIVIVSYQGKDWLGKCLASCQRYASEVPVYVVDNASTDGSAELAAGFAGVTVLRQEVNLGFAGGNNVGLRAAMNDGAEAVMLLNQDAELTSGCLSALTDHLKKNPTVAAVQPAIMLPDGRVNSLGNSYHYLGFGEAGGNGLSREEARERLPWLKHGSEPPYLSGAAMLIRVEALKQVGLLDEDLFMYHEDLELCLRFRLAGWHLAVVPTARVIHHYEPHRSLKQFYYMERNRFIVWLSYFKPATLLLLFIPWLVSELLLTLLALVRGWVGVRLRAYGYLFIPSSWLDIWRRRRRLARLRCCSDRHLLTAAEAVIHSANKDSFITRYLFNPLSTMLWSLVFPLIRW